MFVILTDFAEKNLKNIAIYSVQEEILPTIWKAFSCIFPCWIFSLWMNVIFFSKLLNLLNVNSCLFLNCDLEIVTGCLCRILWFDWSCFTASSFTFRNIKIENWTFHISKKEAEQEVIHLTESRTWKVLLWSKFDVAPEWTNFDSTILTIKGTRCRSWFRFCDIGWRFTLT